MPNITHINVSSVWKYVRQNFVKVSGVWKFTKVIWCRVSGVWKRGGASVLIPVNGIIPFVGTVVPTGFSRYTGADAKFIVGAGSTYTVGATSTGTGTGSYSGTTNNTGGHSGGTNGFLGSGSTQQAFDTTAGAHTHTFSGLNIATLDVCKDFMLIQATVESVIPINGVIMAHAAITTTLAEIETSTNRFLRSNTTYGATAGNATPSGTAGSSSDGSHKHGTLNGLAGTGSIGSDNNTSAGSHSHTITGTLTLNTKYKYLQMLADGAATAIVTNGCIIMWPTATPPTGWVACDGTAGTTDMRDYHLRVGNSTNRGTSGGTNLAPLNYTSNSAGSHHHDGGWGTSAAFPMYHVNSLNSHSHTFSGTSQTITQPYTALTFIMKD